MRVRSKYGARPTMIDNIRFASEKEAKRYCELRLLEKAGEIKNLECQPVLPLFVTRLSTGERTHVCNYVADFTYWDIRKGEQVTEDVKGMRLPLYRLKRRMVEAQYDCRITEI